MPNQIISKAPGRICLFGDHQDYLQLPVIACAINRCMEIKAQPNFSPTLNIYKLDLEEQDIIEIGQPLHDIAKGDFLRLALKVLHRYDCIPDRGFDIEISGNIPINAGLSSSSALTVAWIHFLVSAYGINQKITPKLLAKLAYETEVTEQGSSGGKMDQFTIALGEMIFLDTKHEAVTTFSQALEGMVIGVSGVAKDTFGTLAHLKQGALQAIHQVISKSPDFKISEAKEEDVARFLPHIESQLQPIFEAAVLNHLITQKARSTLQQAELDLAYIGSLMNQHHQLLRDNLKITVPRIDAMIEAAIQAGALGAKIVGSGGGGCIVAIAPKGKENQIIQAIQSAGAVDAFSVSQSPGAQIKPKSFSTL